PLMICEQMQYIKKAANEAVYSTEDIKKVIAHTIPLNLGIVTDISPDVKLALTPSCHILGSSMMHLHIGSGDHNIVYTGEMRFQEPFLFSRPTFNFPRAETLIIESTYGNKDDIFPDYELAVQRFVNSMNTTLSNRGMVLIPVPHIGLAQEILLIIDRYMALGKIAKTKMLVEKSIAEIWSIHEVYSEYLSEEINNLVQQINKNRFSSGDFTVVQSHILDNEPAVIVAPLFSNDGGPSLNYLEQISQRHDSKIILTSYQMPGSLGRFIQEGGKKMSVAGQQIEVRCVVEKIEGLDVHSDYNQLINYVSKLRPKLRRVLVNNGERSKVQNLAASINRMLKIQTQHPSVLEAVKLV
ncbi:MAG TPA: MBL fold metallo-hydrolase RNA specificity domain-containing protein, partial [Nitrososphaeraceae archaeon]|nr:MBL fold metallo-hydrolase RNA specificity domain-containing protein [Nitrososphaeraceae archaeon]